MGSKKKRILLESLTSPLTRSQSLSPNTNMKSISTNQTLFAAGLTYVAFESEDEQICISELVCDMGVKDIIITEDGFFCKTTEVFELLQMFKDNAAELED